MYDSNMATAALGGSSALAVTGMVTTSYVLIAVALIALGGTIMAIVKRYKHRNGPKP